MPSARTRLGLVAVAALIGLGLLFAWRAMPHIPSDAASTAVGTVAPQGSIAPDGPATSPASPGSASPSASATTPISPSGEGCLDRITDRGGWMDLCWTVERRAGDADAALDYYTLDVQGTFVAARWAVVRARIVEPVGEAKLVTFSPAGPADGVCGVVIPNGPAGASGQGADRCTLILGGLAGGPKTRTSAEWTCADCGPATEQIERTIELSQVVSVPAGQRPSWELYGDVGS